MEGFLAPGFLNLIANRFGRCLAVYRMGYVRNVVLLVV